MRTVQSLQAKAVTLDAKALIPLPPARIQAPEWVHEQCNWHAWLVKCTRSSS